LWPFADVLLDAGHGGVDGGTSHGDILEKDINLAVAKKLYSQLQKQKYRVILNRNADYALSEENRWLKTYSRHRKDLAQRKLPTEELPVRMMISLHVNWSRNRSERGPLVLYQKGSPESKALAECLQKKLNPLYGTGQSPVAGKTYYLLNRVKCPTVIVEMGFLSNPADRKMLTGSRHQLQLAEAMAAGIGEYFKLQQHY